jgi:DNA-binding transcriptional regulator YdaS (Cro superfamily)
MVASMTPDEVRALLRKACAKAGSQKAWADAVNLSPQYVSDVLKGRLQPADNIAAALGLRRVVGYERVE